MRGWIWLALMFAGLVYGGVPLAAAEPRILTLESGHVAGMYFPEAGAICRLVNKDRGRHGLHCLVEPTTGSAANLEALQKGEAQKAIVQSRVLAQAVRGSSASSSELRSLMSLHGEAMAVVVAPGTHIRTPADLKGKRVDLGRSGSFQRSMADALLTAEGLGPKDLGAAVEMDVARLPKAICHNEIDAAVVTGLHPVPAVQETLDACAATLLPLKDAAIDKLLKTNPAYVRQAITPETYGSLHDAVPSFGPGAILVTTTRLPADDAYEVVKSVFENLPAMKGMHPVLADLDKRRMAHDGLTAPLHEGALRYFRENALP